MVDSCYCFNPRLLEKQLHQKYGGKRQRRGEFFNLNDDDVVEVINTFKSFQNMIIEPIKLNIAA
jgi:hypothetical protein